jgi:hypothetical protein
MNSPTLPRQTLRYRLAREMRVRKWHHTDGGVRSRIVSVVGDRHPWWDWGHHVMALTGRYDAGNWSPPRVRDMWFRMDYEYGDGRKAKPTRSRIVTTNDYSEVRARNDGEWRIFDSQDDGHTIVIGYWPHPDDKGNIHRTGLDGRAEQRLFLRWMLWEGLVKAEWFGLRRWLYYRALHAAVERKIPFRCQVTPPPGSGGYRHWHCDRKKRHTGDHRFVNYTWAGGNAKVRFDPVIPAAATR